MRSALEEKFLAQVTASGLPSPEREYVFARPRRWRFDFCWSELLVAVEVEGGSWVNGRHNRGTGFRSDVDKYNEATKRGYKVYRVTGDMIHSGEALRVTKEALGA
jgi:hypothetical protein